MEKREVKYYSNATVEVDGQRRRLLISHNRLVLSFGKRELVHVARAAKRVGATSPSELSRTIKREFFRIPTSESTDEAPVEV